MSLRIAAAGNTEVPCYLEILARGYSVTVVRGTETDYWSASKGDNDFLAEDLVSLLGVIAMAESRGREWQAQDHEIDEFLLRYNSQP